MRAIQPRYCGDKSGIERTAGQKIDNLRMQLEGGFKGLVKALKAIFRPAVRGYIRQALIKKRLVLRRCMQEPRRPQDAVVFPKYNHGK